MNTTDLPKDFEKVFGSFIKPPKAEKCIYSLQQKDPSPCMRVTLNKAGIDYCQVHTTIFPKQ